MDDFDPDKYLAATEPTPTATLEFDPDEYLKATAPKPKTAPIIPKSGMQTDSLEARDVMRTSPDELRGTGDQPVIPIPRIPQQKGVLAQLGAGALNAASGLAEMVETPQTLAVLPVAPLRLTQLLFAGQALGDIKTAYEEAAQPGTTIQRGIELGGRAVADALFGVSLVKGATAPRPKLSETLGFEKPKLPTEKIAESAFRLPSGEVVGTGPYHQGEFPKGSEAGFISTSGRFLGREEAGQLATGLKQPLFAEDFVTNHDIVPSLLEHPIAADAIAAGAQKGVPPFTELTPEVAATNEGLAKLEQGEPNAIQEPVSTQPYGVRAEPQVPQETQAPAASIGSERVPEIGQGEEVPGGAGQEVAQLSETGSGPVSAATGEIRKAVDRYDFDEKHAGAGDLANDLEQIRDLPKSLNDALAAYREAEKVDREEYGERSGLVSEHGDALEAEARKWAGQEKETPVERTDVQTQTKIDVSPILTAKSLKEATAIGGKMIVEAKTTPEIQQIQRALQSRKDTGTPQTVSPPSGRVSSRSFRQGAPVSPPDVGETVTSKKTGKSYVVSYVDPEGKIYGRAEGKGGAVALGTVDKIDTPTPKLLPGEKQGDLISSTQQEPFALVGEKAAPGTHPTEIAEAGSRAQAAEEARLKSEYEQGLLEDVQQYQQQGGDEFLVALKDSGGLPAKSSPHQKFSGELQNIREEYYSGTRKEKIKYSDVFRKDAPDPDVVAQRMRAKGFDVSSDTDLLQMARDRIASGRPAYGSEARGESLASDWTGATALRPFSPNREGGFLGSTSGTFKSIAIKKRTPLDAATGQRSERLQKSFTEAERAQKEIRKVAPSDRRQNAISVWMEAGGDMATIDQWATSAKGKMFKRAAEDAKNLSPEEIAIAQKARAAFDVLEHRGNTYDILNAHRDNYVPHVWDVSKKGTGIGSSKLQDKFKFNKARTFDNFFEGDQQGFTPKTMAIGKVLPAYIHEMNRVIADRQFVQDVSDMTASDKRPLVIPRGNAKTVDTTDYIVRDASGQPLPRFQKSVYETQADAQAALKPGQIIEKRPSSSALVNPRGFAKAEDAKGNPIDQRDYKVVDQPALNNWRWVETDPQGGTTILKSDLAVHPELAKRLNAMTGQSAIRQWYNEPSTGISVIPKAIVKGLDTAQSVMKREMFGLLAPFHQVQEGTHAVGHTVNPFSGIPSVERLTPKQADAVRHGLMLLPERTPSQSYIEGVGGKGSFISQAARFLGEKAGQNVVGKALTSISDAIDGYQDFLFHKYIPGLKSKTYDHILDRNMGRYADELKRGEVTESDVKALSATQTDAAYGHLNYAQLDRNPTMQHIMQLTLLAPDFLEARARFTGQALKTLAGEKAGAEQFRAIAVLAATQAGAMYTLSKVLGGEWDAKHPFEMTVRGRRYMLRSVPEDLHRLFFQGPDVRREFVSARVNPAAQKIDQLRTGLNYRGEKTGALETMGELIANYIPITARSIPGVRNLTETSRNNPVSPLEQLAGSLGLKISRYSPITKTHQLASEWMDKKGIARDRGSYPVSKFQQLRYALEDGDLDRARGEWEKLAKGGDKSKLAKGFQQSINHPFTGSIKSDAEFASSLDKPNRMIFDHAQEVRKGIMFKFHSIYSGPYGKPKKNVGAAAYVSP